MAASWSSPSYPTYHPATGQPGHSRSATPRLEAIRETDGYRSNPGVCMPQPILPGFYTDNAPVPYAPRPHSYYPDRGSSLANNGDPYGDLLPPPTAPHLRHSRSASGDYFTYNPHFPQPEVGPQIRFAQSAPVPPLPRKPSFDQPPLPPKPSHSFTGPPDAERRYHHGHSRSYGAPYYPPSPETPKPYLPPKVPVEDDELRLAMELSLKESDALRQKSKDEEDEEIARALQESLQMTGHMPHLSTSSPNNHFLHASQNMGSLQASPIATSPMQSPWSPPATLSRFPRDPEEEVRGNSITTLMMTPSVALPLLPGIDRALSIRSIVPETGLPDDPPAPVTKHDSHERHHHHHHHHEHHHEPASAPPYRAHSSSSVPLSSPAHHAYQSSADIKSAKASMARSISANATLPSQDFHTKDDPELPEYFPDKSETHLAFEKRSPALGSPKGDGSGSISTSSTPASTPGAQSQRVPEELLRGVSMDFGVASVTGSLKPMERAIPNVISLPYDTSRPFHIGGPNWRSLLKLMARLSRTRVEPSLDAITKVKTQMRLRVVVSFVKVHSASSAWNTVLYMTIDHPVPVNDPQGNRYRNGDTTVLPWSYSLSSPPAMLRDGADSPMAKFYTIPSTPGNLYPTLPISFPDLAEYLASALEVSRNGTYESPGLRRLSKLVDTFYPGAKVDHEGDEKTGMRQKLKNLVGFGSKPTRDRNAETYDLVTPFVPDDFGQ